MTRKKRWLLATVIGMLLAGYGDWVSFMNDTQPVAHAPA